ncbi:MAG TPA: PP2C family serine/threonine-protein phosphatase [Candidatus Saccharimonadales bacterium]|nr:PP2C family serine/threonine-protein phosphatase [Candidatus Saccharimonadales bacterium]
MADVRIEAAKVERPFPGKDHDRVFLDNEQRLYGVFDGAANPYASALAAATVQQLVRSSTLRGVDHAFAIIQDNLLTAFGGRLLTTGTLLHIQEDSATFAAAGDSPLYTYDHAAGALRRETIDESMRLPGRINADNFLGSPLHQLKQLGTHALTADTTYALMSDGLTDEFYPGHLTDDVIADALSSNQTSEQIAQELMDRAAVFDDAAVIVVRVSLS